MAPTFRAGKGAALVINNKNIGSVTQDVQVEATVKALDTTVLGNGDETYIAGVRGGSFSFDGLFDGSALSTASTATTGAFDHVFAQALGSTQLIATYFPEGDTLGRRARMAKLESVKYAAMSPADDVVKFGAEGVVSGRQDYGVSLHSLSAATSTGAFTAVDSGIAAGTAGGGVGHFHMTAGTTIATFQTIIEHSSSATAWTTLITFSSSTGTTSAGAFQRSTVSGTVKRHVRANVSVFTGGAANSATFAVAFARRNAPA